MAHLPNWHITVDSTKMRDDNGHGEYRLRYAASVMLAVISCPSGGPQKALSMLSTINENARERSQMMGCEAISRANEKAT
ncbi:hypothetical protein FD19_GL000262 [Lacticaseibacillus thailandensis DSM 22698 = JCM 13996]|uniref:Uncharacterized protein n=1 Tax=Lacticaseibacillus thailandensis DSM 22698 = JCM 13996 TaxID=1423810 RepID=A0A0R2CIB7_9LACO|nr:hypothetical protein FD19_GL000262 [Lacticaseibacillus thailandensis DSM 22698 = JCM 13996]